VNHGNTLLGINGVYAFAESEPIQVKSGAHCWGLALADFVGGWPWQILIAIRSV